MHRVVLLFVDGLGLGAPDADSNPLVQPGLPLLGNYRAAAWRPRAGGGDQVGAAANRVALPAVERAAPLPYGGYPVATDATLGVTGLPQSATGQTTILTGENSARLLGRHLYGFPNAALRRVLLRASVLRRVVEAGSRATFANAYRPRFFELGEAIWQRRLSATTWACRAAGLPFRDLDAVRAGRAVYQDITHETLIERGFALAPRAPEQAGAVLAAVAAEHRFTLFEFFQTDRAGHGQDRARAAHELHKLERFLAAALGALDLATTTVIVTSDHGNIEDLSVHTHTLNPVATLVFGRRAAATAARIDRLEAITPAVLELLGAPC